MTDNNSTIKNFLSFIKKPDYKVTNTVTSLGKRIIAFIKLYVISIILVGITNSIITLLVKFQIIDVVDQNINLPQSGEEFKRFYLYILPIMIPILEEFSFRLLLTQYNKSYIIFSISLILGFYSYQLLSPYLWVSSNKYLYSFAPYLYIFIIALGYSVILFFVSQFARHSNFQKFWNSKFKYIFYFMSLLFSLHHISSLNLTTDQYYFLPLILFPFFIYAIVLGYVRIKFGLLYSIILHFLYLIPLTINQII